jgi:hypothetical protein
MIVQAIFPASHALPAVNGRTHELFEADYHSHNFLSPRDIVICGVEENLDLADYGRLLIDVAWIGRSELRPSELRPRWEVPFNKNCWIYPLITNRK